MKVVGFEIWNNFSFWTIKRFQTNYSSINNTLKVHAGITFLLFDQQLQQTIPFHLKAQVEECFTILWKDVKRPRPDTRTILRQQASKTAWKIFSDWTEIQCSMILLGQAKPLQMFLPFMYDTKNNETLFDKVSTGKVKLLPQ